MARTSSIILSPDVLLLMGTETVTQYETVRREEKIMFCDDCSADEDQLPVIPVSIHAHKSEQREETQQMMYQGNEPALVKDLCARCIEQQFDLDIPDEGKVESFNIQSNGVIKIENKVDKKAIFPGLEYKLRRYFIYDAILMPLLLATSATGWIDEETGWYAGENMDYAFHVGVLGTIIWTLASILLLLIIFGFL